jgi:hypothetical protein
MPRRGSLREGSLWTARLVGAAALLAMAAVHLQQLAGGGFSHVHTIGPLFGLNAAGGVVVAIAVLAWRSRIPALLGLAIAGGALIALYISEHGGLFGYVEAGYRAAIVIAIVSEAIAVVALAGAVVLMRPGSRRESTSPGRFAGRPASLR